ncbi:hypothetical protein SESBI_10210, partial [Sesbania bispinosa]
NAAPVTAQPAAPETTTKGKGKELQPVPKKGRPPAKRKSNSYDWKKVAQQLGLTQDEGYMGFMEQVEEAKNFCQPQEGTPTTANDNSPAATKEGGT